MSRKKRNASKLEITATPNIIKMTSTHAKANNIELATNPGPKMNNNDESQQSQSAMIISNVKNPRTNAYKTQ